MSFFDSEIVQSSLNDIFKLQESVRTKSFYDFHRMNRDEKIEYVKILETLLEKQQILYARLSLSDDPQACIMRDNILNTMNSLGLSSNIDMNSIFSDMSLIIQNLKKSIV